tara:strand:+ start:297 stop:584 length:288 start_codon:yes stop_codon:yes gene_type:complete
MKNERIREFEAENQRRLAQYIENINKKCAVYNQAIEDTRRLLAKKYAAQPLKLKALKHRLEQSSINFKRRQDQKIASFKKRRKAALVAFVKSRKG